MRKLYCLVLLFFMLSNGFAQSVDTLTLLKDAAEYLQKRDYLRALEEMNTYLKILPNNKDLLNNTAICKYYLGDMEGSCKDLQQAVNLGVKRNRLLYKSFCDREYQIKNLLSQYYRGEDVSAERGYRPIYTLADTLRGALRPERTCFDIFFYDLTVRILPSKKSIEGKNTVWFTGIHASREIQLDLFPQYTISSITMEGKELSFRREYNAIFIEIPDGIQIGKQYALTVAYSGNPAQAKNPPWDGGIVWSRDKRMNRWAGIACEHLGASSWWPNKDHLSDRPDSMAIHIEVPRKYEAVCNGQLQSKEKVDKAYTRFNWFVSYPINNYNVTFYMGKYTSFTDTIIANKDTLLALYHVMPYNKKKAINHFKQASEVVSFYNEAFGPFPFWEDKFRMCESPFGGMEHQTAIAFGDDYSNVKNSIGYYNRSYDFLIVHEAAHEWWGNSVGAADMADIWLHEGFATYAEFLFLEHALGYEASLAEVQYHFQFINNVWPLVQNRDVNENTFAGQDVYTKGATLLHCLRSTMDNDTLFKSMLRDFHLKYRESTLHTNDFINFVHDYTGQNYSALFNIFLYETHLPVLQYSYKRSNGNLVFNYKWMGTDEDFKMPFSIKIIDSDASYRLMATTIEQEVVLEDAESFYFFNQTRKTDGCPHNGLSYYYTKLEDRD